MKREDRSGKDALRAGGSMKEKAEKQVKILFICRIIMWIIALVATIYWMYVSFKIYADGIFDAFSYAEILRPVFYPCVIISVAAIAVSFILRWISDKIKEMYIK